jgi:hypothetical protein
MLLECRITKWLSIRSEKQESFALYLISQDGVLSTCRRQKSGYKLINPHLCLFAAGQIHRHQEHAFESAFDQTHHSSNPPSLGETPAFNSHVERRA